MSSVQAKACPAACYLLGVPLHDINGDDAVAAIVARAQAGKAGYAMAAPAVWWTHAWRNAELAGVYRHACMAFPDAVWAPRISGAFGPRLRTGHAPAALTRAVAAAAEAAGVSVFVAAPTAEAVDIAVAALARQFPKLAVAGRGVLPREASAEADSDALHAAIRAASPALVLLELDRVGHALWIERAFEGAPEGPFGFATVGGLSALAGRRAFPASLPSHVLYRGGVVVGNAVRVMVAWAKAVRRQRQARRVGDAEGDPPVTPPDTASLAGLPATLALFSPLASDAAAEACLAQLGVQARFGTLLVDLQRCAWLDSREVGVLVWLAQECRKHGGSLALCRVHPRIAALAEASRLTDDLAIPASMDALLKDLRRRKDTEGVGVASADGATMRIRLPAELSMANLEPFRARVAAVWSERLRLGGVQTLLVDAAELTFLDSAAMGYLVYLRRIAMAAGVAVNFAGFRDAARQSLKLARLEQLFGVSGKSTGDSA